MFFTESGGSQTHPLTLLREAKTDGNNYGCNTGRTQQPGAAGSGNDTCRTGTIELDKEYTSYYKYDPSYATLIPPYCPAYVGKIAQKLPNIFYIYLFPPPEK